jgi:hypothetical protein
MAGWLSCDFTGAWALRCIWDGRSRNAIANFPGHTESGSGPALFFSPSYWFAIFYCIQKRGDEYAILGLIVGFPSGLHM